jgi:uncharacterized membrane protein
MTTLREVIYEEESEECKDNIMIQSSAIKESSAEFRAFYLRINYLAYLFNEYGLIQKLIILGKLLFEYKQRVCQNETIRKTRQV